MACGPNRAPGRCEVPPSNGAPMIMMSVPAQEGGSPRSARGTPRNVASGPYIPPSRAMTSPQLIGASPAALVCPPWPGPAQGPSVAGVVIGVVSARPRPDQEAVAVLAEEQGDGPVGAPGHAQAGDRLLGAGERHRDGQAVPRRRADTDQAGVGIPGGFVPAGEGVRAELVPDGGQERARVLPEIVRVDGREVAHQ